MKKHSRKTIDQKTLDEALVYKNLRSLLPKVNDYAKSESNYTEELNELFDFNIKTNKDLRLLLKKHRKQLIMIDRSPMDTYHKNMYRQEMGSEIFNDHMRRNYWFAYPALLRIAMELEFGKTYEDYANKRDHITEQ
jgi:hypothetical protein